MGNMTPLEIAKAFVEAINSKDVEQMTGLMTTNHKFIDGDGSEHSGRVQMSSGWREHFELIPDLNISVYEHFEEGDTVVFLGWTNGTIVENGELKPENAWRIPAAWRVVVESDKVAVWQLYANQYELHRIYKRINTA